MLGSLVLASSASSERLFSKAGSLKPDKRNRLTGEHLDQLVFLNGLPTEDWFLHGFPSKSE